MLASLFALSFNTVMAYGLIFGRFGLPELGVQGAAIATAVARCLECAILLVITYHYRLPVAARFPELVAFKAISLRHFFKTSVPVIFTEAVWSLGITTYNVVYARIGTEAIAAVNIAVTIDRVLFVVFIGLGNACAIMIGNRIGANEEHKAFEYARRFLVLGPALAVFIGLALVLGIDAILSFYRVSSLTVHNAHNLLMIMALVLPLRVANLILLVGILRSGGDTHFAFFLDAVGVWVIGVPLAFIGAFVFQLPVYSVYALVLADELFKFSLGLWRMFSRKWIHNLVAPA
jgi:putative MATE family efflux protein